MPVEGLDEGAFNWAGGNAEQRVVRAGWRSDGVGVLVLARPAAANAWNGDMWTQWEEAIAQLAANDTLRVVVLCAEGPVFTGGLDLSYLAQVFAKHQGGAGAADGSKCPARQRVHFGRDIRVMQRAYTLLEQQPWPVIAAVHGACVGAGVDLVTACDLRYATRDAYFCVKEVDVGITADLGTLQRLPRIVGQGVAAEMALTARRVGGEEAVSIGLASRCFATPRDMMAHAMQVAADIASKSPLAVWGTKRVLLAARDTASVAEGLEHVATHNAAFLLSEDIGRIVAARASKQAPRFAKL